MRKVDAPEEKTHAMEDIWALGDHPALNMLNTVVQIDGQRVDGLQDDEDVLRFLQRFGWPVEHTAAPFTKGSLLRAARILRETIRTAVTARKAGKRADVTELNRFLGKAHAFLELTAKRDGVIELERKWNQRTPEESLAPLAEAAAELLATADFNLVRRCENEDCVLWFYDRTRSHHRRWCSMATCGNRHKVAAFRKRQAEGS